MVDSLFRGVALRKVTTLALAVVLLLGGCLHTVDVSGSVLDSRTNKPIAEAEVRAGELKTKTGSNGKFNLADVPKDVKLTITAANYEPLSRAPSKESLKLRLKPIPVTGVITNNLTGDGVAARIIGKEEVQAAPDGTFTIFGVGPGDELTARADGFEEQKVKIEASRDVKLTLLADPATTLKQIRTWEAVRNYDKAWEWVYPDAHTYVSKEEWVKGISEAHAEGYVVVGVDIHEVTYTTWEFVCRKSGKVAFQKVFSNTATLRTTYHSSTPGGGGLDQSAVSHLVKTQDGKWGWFPIGNCD